MKRTMYLVAGMTMALVVMASLLLACASAPSPTPSPKPTPAASPKPAASPSPAASPAPTKSALPAVPITYAGDTDATIIRRAQLVEAAKKEGAVEWWSILKPEEGTKVLAEFMKVYPFIKANHWRGTGEEIATKVEAEAVAGRGTVDVSGGGELNNYPRWRDKGMLEKFTDVLPNLNTIDKRLYSKFGDWAIPGSLPTTPAYNTKLIPNKADAPKSWEDVLDPKWKGAVGVVTDMKTYVTLAVEENGWGLEKTEQFLTKLKDQKPIWGSGTTATHALLVAGEFKVMAAGYVYHTLQAQEIGAPVEWVRASPVAVAGPPFLLFKKAPHPNAAKLLLEWLFSPQGLETYERITYYSPVTPGSTSRLAKAVEGLKLAFRTEEGVQKGIDLGLFAKYPKILGITQ